MEEHNKQANQARLIVTIDGPAGVGKSTTAKRVADTLGIAYLDTGAMFRTMALRLGDVQGCSEEEIGARARALVFSLQGSGSETRLLCNGAIVGSEIRTEEVGQLASKLAAVPVVREVLKDVQRRMGQETSLVAEGRDMGTVIFPAAPFKFFIDASPRVRAMRRMGDLKAMGKTVSLADLEKQIRARDERDRNRTVAPLCAAEDALCIDSSNMTPDEVLAAIVHCVRGTEVGATRILAGECADLPLSDLLEGVRERCPLVHFITNYVTVNDCANITMAIGAAPVMADAPEEVAEVTSLANALVLNLGTLNERTAKAMVLAGKAAREAGHPVMLDPVGAGISKLRNSTVQAILDEVHPTVIKGNLSEIRALLEGTGGAHGVDIAESDKSRLSDLRYCAELARSLAQRLSCVVVLSAPVDIVADGQQAYAVHNGHELMSRVSGTGCMAAGLLGAFVGAHPDNQLAACVAAMVCMGLAGERAFALMPPKGGTGIFRVLFHDAMSLLGRGHIERGAKVQCLEMAQSADASESGQDEGQEELSASLEQDQSTEQESSADPAETPAADAR